MKTLIRADASDAIFVSIGVYNALYKCGMLRPINDDGGYYNYGYTMPKGVLCWLIAGESIEKHS